MEENTNQPETGQGSEQPFQEIAVPKEPDIALTDAMTGVITEPGATFEAIKKASKRNYWLVPLIIVIVISIVSSYLITHDEELFASIKQKQVETFKKNMEDRVKEGKMSQEEMEQSMERMEEGLNRSNPLFIAISILGPIIGAFVLLFLKGLIFWGVLKIFKSTASYMEIICVAGLVSIISAIQVIIDTALAIFTGNINANIGPSLFLTAETIGEQLEKFFSHFDLIAIWGMVVLGIGFAKVSGLKTQVSLSVVFVLWIIWICFTSFLKLPFFLG
jgi:hypothetical protein